MNLIKGFVSINSYVNNTPGQVAPLGELSTWSETYSRDKGEYTDLNFSNLKLTTFKSVNATTNANHTLISAEVLQVFNIVGSCLQYSNNHVQPYDSNDFRNYIISLYSAAISSFNFGPFVSNGFVAIPQWLSWNDLTNGGNQVKIWLSDAAFREQYDEYQIDVIPAVDVLDGMFGFFTGVSAAINANTVTQMYQKIDLIKNNQPETFIRVLPFEYRNNLNPAQRLMTNWAVVIYGKAGDYIDAIKEAITTYVLAHSTKTLTEWESVLPELFLRTEFVLVPLWHKKSIPNLTDLSALYSSIVKCKEVTTFVRSMYPNTVYPSNYIADNLSIMPYDFKGISLAVLPAINNVFGRRELTELFPDYIAVPTSSLDFSRMTINTSGFSLMLGRLLVAAESASSNTSLPNDFRRVTRDSKTYISAVYDNINYMMLTASNSEFTV
jgi:hypothetical protein